MLRMYPIIDIGMAGSTLTLSNFIFMVRKNVIDAASMDIEMLPKIFGSHGTALEMPARKATAPRTIPGHLSSWLGHFPQGKIFQIVPVRVHSLMNASLHIFQQVA